MFTDHFVNHFFLLYLCIYGHAMFCLEKNQINLFIRTKRNLHSHTEKAPLTTHHNQVTGYGDVSSM